MTNPKNHFIEIRIASGAMNSVAANVMRHLQTRQYLGTAVVVADSSLSMMCAARKQWLRLVRGVQRARSSTLNADKILKYTQTITHMQHERFVNKTPLDQPDADIYFLQPEQLSVLPPNCFTFYILSTLNQSVAPDIMAALPEKSLIVDYSHAINWRKLGVQPKSSLDTQTQTNWHALENFLLSHQIRISKLLDMSRYKVTALDDALDELLGVSHEFLQLASQFQQSLELSRPLRLTHHQRQQFDIAILLAHRVQSLTPSALPYSFLNTYAEDDSFFLHDGATDVEQAVDIASLIAQHRQAGRHRLADAIQIAPAKVVQSLFTTL